MPYFDQGVHPRDRAYFDHPNGSVDGIGMLDKGLRSCTLRVQIRFMVRNITLLAVLAVAGPLRSQCISSYPSLENFSGFTSGTPGTFVNNWTNLSGDDLQWNADNNGTPTANTGPIGDHTTYNTGGKYLYVEASGSGNTPGKTAIVESPCFDLAGLTSPYLTFWYHMRGGQMGSLLVDISVNGVVTTGLWSVSGDQGRYWKQGWLDLAAYSGQNTVRIRFRGITGSGGSLRVMLLPWTGQVPLSLRIHTS